MIPSAFKRLFFHLLDICTIVKRLLTATSIIFRKDSCKKIHSNKFSVLFIAENSTSTDVQLADVPTGYRCTVENKVFQISINIYPTWGFYFSLKLPIHWLNTYKYNICILTPNMRGMRFLTRMSKTRNNPIDYFCIKKFTRFLKSFII